jgi:hypothetical protein
VSLGPERKYKWTRHTIHQRYHELKPLPLKPSRRFVKPSPELTAKVTTLKAQREEEVQFQRFCDERIRAINLRYRSLARAATNAEDYLRSGLHDPYIEEAAWGALQRYRDFEALVERDELCNLHVLRTEWSTRDAA